MTRPINLFFPLYWTFRNMAAADCLVKRFSLLITFIKTYPEFSREEQLVWALLDTYDSLTDYNKHLRTPKQIEAKLTQLGAKDIWINQAGNGLEARNVR